MKTLSRGLLMVFTLLLFAASAGAQWTNVAPGLLGNDPAYGAMQFRDGIVWAGFTNLWSSKDNGATWQSVPSFPTSDTITDIAFYDNLNGLISTNHAVYHTEDGGQTWTQVVQDDNNTFKKVSFNGSAKGMHYLNFGGVLSSSVDGGQTWYSSNAGSDTRSIAVANDGTIYVISSQGTGAYLGDIAASNDVGMNWSAGGQNVDGDCFTLSVDSCDPKRLYLVNEQENIQTDSIAKIYLSIDGGATWQVTASHNIMPYLSLYYYSGAMTTTSSGVFVGTVGKDGILRSIDQGMTWVSIGGPSTLSDSRNIAAIDNNTILAADPNGSIWVTRNSGGDSLPAEGTSLTYSFSPQSLFTADSLLPCDPPVVDTIVINASAMCGSNLPNVKSEYITGLDSGDYTIKKGVNSPFGNLDTVIVSFVPSDTGARTGKYELVLDDSIIIPVMLGGYGNSGHILTLATANAATDTIGATVNVPINIGGLVKTEDIDIVMHYDTRLEYENSFDMSGNKVDIPGQQWAGRSELHLPNAVPGVQQGYSSFNVWSDTTGQPVVTFDSINVLSATPCEYVLPPPDTSVITPIAGCGIALLSKWVHLGELPRFSIQPNPTSGDVTISCDDDIGDATIAVYDMLGAERASVLAAITQASPAHISLPNDAGVYYIRVISQAGIDNMRVIVIH